MKVSDSARDALLNVMRSQNMDPKIWYFELQLLSSGAIGIGFIKDLAQHRIETFDNLSLAIDLELDTKGFAMDFTEHNGRKGLVFGTDAQLGF